jgi:four helix bundle protein
MPIKSFLDLEIYQESLQLAGEVNQEVKNFPADEKFLLVDQSRRSSRAIPSLIAEAWAKRKTIKEFRRKLREAMGEANETMNHLAQAKLFGYLRPEKAKELINRYDNLTGKISNLKDNWKNYRN